MEDFKTSDNTSEPCGNFAAFPKSAGESLDPSPPPPASQDPLFFARKGISRLVQEKRPYLTWRSAQELKDFCRDYQLADRQHAAKVANQCPTGLIICRSFGGTAFDHDPRWPSTYLPELRSDTPVVTSGHWHCHPSTYPDFENWPTYPKSGKRLPRAYVLPPDKAEKHIAKRHAGVNREEVHYTPNIAKYQFFPGAGAKVIDVHPLALASLFVADRIYFGLEGCIKADAILSQLLSHCSSISDYCARIPRSSVVSVPSVTLWDAEELEPWIQLFPNDVYRNAGRPTPEIVLVCDADHHKNPLVRQQTLLLRSRARLSGLQVVIAAPPRCTPGEGRHIDCEGDSKCPWNGADDYLGPVELGGYGGSLEDLVVLEREAPDLGAWMLEQKFRGRREDAIRRNAKFLAGLALHAANETTEALQEGQYRGSIRSISRATGLHVKAGERAARDLVVNGVINVTSSDGLATGVNALEMSTRKYRSPSTGKWTTSFDWEDNPTFTVPKQLRCEPDGFRRLGPPVAGDWRAIPDKTHTHILKEENLIDSSRTPGTARGRDDHHGDEHSHPERANGVAALSGDSNSGTRGAEAA